MSHKHKNIFVYNEPSESPQDFFRFSSITKTKAIKFLVLMLFVLAVPATIFLSQQPQDVRQHAAGCRSLCVKITSLIPSVVLQNNVFQSQEVIVNGAGFVGKAGMPDPLHQTSILIIDAVVNGKKDSVLSFDAVIYVSETKLKGVLPRVLDAGVYSIEAVNPDGSVSILPHALTVQ